MQIFFEKFANPWVVLETSVYSALGKNNSLQFLRRIIANQNAEHKPLTEKDTRRILDTFYNDVFHPSQIP